MDSSNRKGSDSGSKSPARPTLSAVDSYKRQSQQRAKLDQSEETFSDAESSDSGIDIRASSDSQMDYSRESALDQSGSFDNKESYVSEETEDDDDEENSEILVHESPTQRRGNTKSDNDAATSEDETSADESNSIVTDTEKTDQQPPIVARRSSEWDRALMAGKAFKGRAPGYFTSPRVETKKLGASNTVDENDAIVSQANAAVGVEIVKQDGRQTVTNSLDSPSRQAAPPPPPPPPLPPSATISVVSHASSGTQRTNATLGNQSMPNMRPPLPQQREVRDENLSAGVLPDVLMTMRQKIESMTLFDSDMMKLAASQVDGDTMWQESRESLRRSLQQSISAAVLVSLAHKRYERRRLAAMEIEKVVRSLVHQNELDRVRAILLLLSDDYVRSTNEDARKGGVVALAASAIGLKKGNAEDPVVQECRDLILASVVHACQDHSQRVRYYATESLFNVVKIMPTLAIQHFFILFEILRSLYADVDADVRSGAKLLDKKLKDVIVGAINSGIFTADACIPVFARFVYLRNKATNQLTLSWLQELSEKLSGSPILEFLHLFLGGIFDMVADPTVAIKQSALAFLRSVLPKLLVLNSDSSEEFELSNTNVDFDKILQSLVTTMEHPDPFVRKVAMYWMSRIVKAHMGPPGFVNPDGGMPEEKKDVTKASPASASVRNSLPHMLPGILLSIGDNFQTGKSSKDFFLPEQTTHALAEQTNACLQDAVRRDGNSYIPHLDGFIVALREELDSSGGLGARNTPAVERTPYRMDVKDDGTGIESSGWFRSSKDVEHSNTDSMIMARLCALNWVTVLYESVVPDLLKADYAREFIFAIINQLVDNPPKSIVEKSLEVLAKITVPVSGEDISRSTPNPISALSTPSWATPGKSANDDNTPFPMTEASIAYSLDILEPARRKLRSRNREVFAALLQLYSYNESLLEDLSKVIKYMCSLQPAEFVMLSFSVELERFTRSSVNGMSSDNDELSQSQLKSTHMATQSRYLKFAACVVQNMSHVLLNAAETKELRQLMKDCIGLKSTSERDRQRSRIFHILLYSFSHSYSASLTLCLWSGAYKTASIVLSQISPLDIDLPFLLELDRLVETLERPLFRHIHIRMLEYDKDPEAEGSGTMLCKVLKLLLMTLPQSTCYRILRDRLHSTARYRQCINTSNPNHKQKKQLKSTVGDTELYCSRILAVRSEHRQARWQAIRAESLETPRIERELVSSEGEDRRKWLGYNSQEEQSESTRRFRHQKSRQHAGNPIEEIQEGYQDISKRLQEPGVSLSLPLMSHPEEKSDTVEPASAKDEEKWRRYWADGS